MRKWQGRMATQVNKWHDLTGFSRDHSGHWVENGWEENKNPSEGTSEVPVESDPCGVVCLTLRPTQDL